MSLLLLFKPIYRPMKATQWVSDKGKVRKVKKHIKVEEELPTESIYAFVSSLTKSALTKLKREEKQATEIQEGVISKIKELRRKWQEDEDNLIAAFLFELI